MLPDDQSAAARLRAAISEVPDVQLAYLFGSRASGAARPESDFDIGILLHETSARAERGSTIRRLAGRLGREVSSALLDIVILNDAPALLRHRILRDGVVLYEQTPEVRVRFAIRTIREYQDGCIRRDEFTRRRIERIRTGHDHGGSRDLLEAARGAARLLGQARRLS